jgi:hypothetical protein
MAGERHGRGMLCVNPPLAHGMAGERHGHGMAGKEPASQAAAPDVNLKLARRRHWNNRNYGARKRRLPHATPDNSHIQNFNTNRAVGSCLLNFNICQCH